MEYQNILFEVREQIAYVTINRPQKLNALNKAVLLELADVIALIVADTNVCVGIVTGTGDKAFVAGADISEFKNYSVEEGKFLAKMGQTSVFDAIENCPKPIIAAINGFALGGGLELALACHIRIGAEQAKLGLPEVSLGLIPGYGGTQRLSQLVGKGMAFEMITTGEPISAQKAEKIGLLTHVVASADLISKAEEIAGKIKLRAPLAVSFAIRAVNAANTPQGYEIEMDAFSQCFGTEDFKEGVAAFLEKRPPVFKAW